MPVRVAIAYDCLFPFTTGGGERQYRAFAEELARRGAEVTYLTTRQWDGAAPDAPFEVVAATGRLRLYDSRGVRSSLAALRFAWGLFRQMRRTRGDYDLVIVSALPIFNVFAARLALLGTRSRLMLDYLEVWGRRQWVAYAGGVTGRIAWVLQRIAIALTPTATCHSALSARRLRAEGLRGALLLSPGLIDAPTARDAEASAREAIADRPAAAGAPFVLYAGRHIADKRVETLPAAIAHARAERPDLRLVVLGAGPSTDAVRAAVDAVDGSSWTDVRGFVEQDELDELMAAATVFANPSRREGYGLVVVEAAAHGTPVVLVDDPGNASTELVEEGVNGHVAADATPASLGEAILEAVRGGAPLRASTRAWHRDAMESRTIARTIDQVLGALATSAARRNTSSDQESTPSP